MMRTSKLCELPALLRRAAVVLDGVAHEQPRAGAFALVEHAWHLVDLEVEGFQRRIERLQSEREPRLVGFDGDQIARERRYLERPLAPAINGFARARAATVAQLVEIRGRAWLRSGTQDEVGFVMLGHMPGRILDHDRSHAIELAELIAVLRARDPLIETLRAWAAGISVPPSSPCNRREPAAHRHAVPLSLQRVQQAIVAALPDGEVTTEAISRALGMSPRTLQRRLAGRGLTLHCLVEETRAVLAGERVSAGATIGQTAGELGFADARAFARAFKRWTGTTPSRSRTTAAITSRTCR